MSSFEVRFGQAFDLTYMRSANPGSNLEEMRSLSMFNFLGLKSDPIIPTFLNDPYPFLSGQFDHTVNGFLIFGKIIFLKGNAFFTIKLFRRQTLGSGK